MKTAVAEKPIPQTREKEGENRILTVTSNDLLWLPDQNRKVILEERRSQLNRTFLYGELVVGRDLERELDQLKRTNKFRQIENLLRTHLPLLADNNNQDVDMATHPRIGNGLTMPYFSKADSRIYLVRFPPKDGKPVIIMVAACDKSRQGRVLGVLTDTTRKYIKHVGRL